MREEVESNLRQLDERMDALRRRMRQMEVERAELERARDGGRRAKALLSMP